MKGKSTVDQIRARFDADVERFAKLETGQSATIDAPVALELIASTAAAATPHARHLLDIGCGAGNFSLKALERLPNLDVTLIDLSQPMLDRAVERIRPRTNGLVTPMQLDIRKADLGSERFDIILAAAVLHHLRAEDEWVSVFSKLYNALTPGGSLWIFDLIEHSIPAVQQLMWARYGDYLAALKGTQYRDHVFAYIEQEDTPRPLLYQLNLLASVGFRAIDVVHKNGAFAAFGASK